VRISTKVSKYFKCNLTLDFCLSPNLSTPLYQCINSTNTDSVLRNYILGHGFAKPRLILFLKFAKILGWGYAGRQGLGGNARNTEIQTPNRKPRAGLIFILPLLSRVLNGTPRHPPRALPLWLLAPTCLGMVTAQIPGNEPLPYFSGRGSFLSPGRTYS
jgi:hypothetical protein